MFDSLYSKKKEGKDDKGSLELWPIRIKNTMDYFKDHPRGHKAWRTSIDLFHGDHWKKHQAQWLQTLASDDPMLYATVPITTSTVNSFLPYLTKKDPKYLFGGQDPSDEIDAKLTTIAMQKEWKIRKNKLQFKSIVKDSLVIGFGIGFSHYNIDIPEAKNPKVQGNIEYDLKRMREATVFKRIDPFRFYWEPESPDRNLDSARFCFQIFVKSRQDVADNDRYPEKVRNTVYRHAKSASSYITKNQIQASMPGEQDKIHENDIILIKVWDKKFMQTHLIADGCYDPDDWLEAAMDWPYIDEMGDQYLDSFPFTMLPFITLINEPFPIGIPYLIKDQQLQLNKSRSMMFRHANAQKRLIWYNGDHFPDSDIEAKIKQSPDMAMVRTTAPGEVSIGVVQDAPMNSDIFAVDQTVKQDVRDTTGSSELARGGNMPSGTTATEVNARMQVLGLKIEDVQDNVDAFIYDVGSQQAKHIMMNFSMERMVKLAGELGKQWHMRPDPLDPTMLTPYVPAAEDVINNFDLEIESTVNTQDDPSQEKQIRQQMVQTFMAMGLPFDPKETVRWMMEPFGYKDISRLFPVLSSPPSVIGEAPTSGMTSLGDVLNQQQQMNQDAVNPVSEEQGPEGVNNAG